MGTSNSTIINVEVNNKTEKQSKKLFDSLGLDTTTAINIFLKKSIEVGGIPFEVKHDECSHVPNEQTIKALEKAELLEKKRTKPEGYNNSKDFMNAILNKDKK